MDLSELLAANVENGQPFEIRVTPRASANCIKLEPQPGGRTGIRVYVTAVPEGGRANAAAVKLLSKALGVAKSRIEILRGGSARTKTLRIAP
ncbi:MAG: DUF167 domain-containing protein [Paracoccaceae bacterium]